MSQYLDKTGLQYFWQKIVSKFVAKESGKGLSTNDFTTELKNKLDGIAAGANKYTLPTASSTTLGGIKVGSGLSISNGVLSANSSGFRCQKITGTVSIGSYNDDNFTINLPFISKLIIFLNAYEELAGFLMPGDSLNVRYYMSDGSRQTRITFTLNSNGSSIQYNNRTSLSSSRDYTIICLA